MNHQFKYVAYLLLLFLISSCNNQKMSIDMDTIEYDPKLDNPNYKICNENKIKEHFQFYDGIPYEGDKRGILDYFSLHYSTIDNTLEGYIRFRFVINCEGHTDRFRILASDKNYKPLDLDEVVEKQLRSIVQGLKKWKKLSDLDGPIDYNQTLILVIDKGKIKDISA